MGRWKFNDKLSIQLTRSDGTIESWNFLYKSKSFVTKQNISGKILTGSYKPYISKHVSGIADFNGSFRVFHNFAAASTPEQEATLSTWFHRQGKITAKFYEWQSTWTARYASYIAAQREEIIRQQKLKDEELEAERQRKEAEQERIKKEQAKLLASKMKPLPGKYSEWAERRWVEGEQKRMNTVLITMKQLNPEQLRKQQIPLKQIEKEEKIKRQKQVAKQANAQKIFEESVAMYFPHVLQKKKTFTFDPYASEFNNEELENCYSMYQQNKDTLTEYISLHPFTYFFDWYGIMNSAKDRVQPHNPKFKKSIHKDRFAYRKNQIEEGDTEEAPKEVVAAAASTESEED